MKTESQIITETLENAASLLERAVGRVPITGVRAAKMIRDSAPVYAAQMERLSGNTSNESNGEK